MKKAILCFVLLMACTLSACSSSDQDEIDFNDANQSAPASTEVSIPETTDPQEDTAAEIPAAYAELLDTYITALNEKWDGNALLAQGLNLIALDLYDGAPLDNIGYTVKDLDGNGTDELVIGTTANVTDDFYGKVIFDLYTLGQDDTRIQVLSSSARNRYFYAGEKLFVDLGSSSADDSTNATMCYEGMGLTDTNKITAPEDYVQMDLIPLSRRADGTVMPSKSEKGNASAELVGLLDEIDQDVTTGITGSYMAAVPIAVKLLNWGVGTEMTAEEIRSTVIDYMMPKGNDESVTLCNKLATVDEIYQKLLGNDAQDLLASAGCVYDKQGSHPGAEPLVSHEYEDEAYHLSLLEDHSPQQQCS